MKVILVNGSPHKNGCTYTALKEIADTLNTLGIETEIFHIGSAPIAGCIDCKKCMTTGHCTYNDIVNIFLSKVETEKYDGFVFGSPVYFASASGQLMSFMDRAFYGRRKLFENKLGCSVVSCRRGGASSTFDEINKYFTISCMPVVSSQYWNQVHGNTPDEVRQDLEGMQTMRTLARNMAWLLQCIEAGRNAGISLPSNEPIIRTNFIR